MALYYSIEKSSFKHDFKHDFWSFNLLLSHLVFYLHFSFSFSTFFFPLFFVGVEGHENREYSCVWEVMLAPQIPCPLRTSRNLTIWLLIIDACASWSEMWRSVVLVAWCPFLLKEEWKCHSSLTGDSLLLLLSLIVVAVGRYKFSALIPDTHFRVRNRSFRKFGCSSYPYIFKYPLLVHNTSVHLQPPNCEIRLVNLWKLFD